MCKCIYSKLLRFVASDSTCNFMSTKYIIYHEDKKALYCIRMPFRKLANKGSTHVWKRSLSSMMQHKYPVNLQAAILQQTW